MKDPIRVSATICILGSMQTYSSITRRSKSGLEENDACSELELVIGTQECADRFFRPGMPYLYGHGFGILGLGGCRVPSLDPVFHSLLYSMYKIHSGLEFATLLQKCWTAIKRTR
jgi:hypothetical protein